MMNKKSKSAKILLLILLCVIAACVVLCFIVASKKQAASYAIEVVEWAESQIGYSEMPYNNTIYNTYHYGKTVSAKNADDSAYAWCGTFIIWCFCQAGCPEAIPNEPYVPKMQQVCAQNGVYKTKDPNPGDLIFIDYDGNNVPNHVGLVREVKDGYVYTIEGNVGDKVVEKERAIDSRYIMGYATPRYPDKKE